MNELELELDLYLARFPAYRWTISICFNIKGMNPIIHFLDLLFTVRQFDADLSNPTGFENVVEPLVAPGV